MNAGILDSDSDEPEKMSKTKRIEDSIV